MRTEESQSAARAVPLPFQPKRGVPKAPHKAKLAWPRLLLWIAAGLLALFELVLLLRTSALVKLNSDEVLNVLTVSDILKGNLLLHGWVLATDNFYLSDNPFFLVTRLLFGRTLLAIYAAPFLVYIVFLLGAIGIVRLETSHRRALIFALGILVFYLGTPSLHDTAPVTFVGNVHIAALTFDVLAWLALTAALKARTGRAVGWFAALYAAAALVALMSDPLAVVVFCIPTLIGLFFALLAPSRRPIHAGLAGLTLAALVGAHFGLAAIEALGGFTMVLNHSLKFVSAANLGRNATGVFFGLLKLSGGYVFERSLDRPDTVVTAIRVLGLALMLTAAVAALRRGLKRVEGWDLRLVLAIAVLINIASCLASDFYTHALVPTALTGGAAIRYLSPSIMFGGILAALELPGMVSRIAAPALRGTSIGICGLALFAAAWQFGAHGILRWREEPATARQPARIAGQWLQSRGLTHGVGPYWAANIITALSSQKVAVRAVHAENSRLEPFLWLSKRAWYHDKPRPQFVIYEPKNDFGVTTETITNTYGAPTSIEHVAGYDIALFSRPPQ